jgi:holo-[acyl-carrier protein] synthase
LEREIYGQNPQRLAARFAVKEAVGKALGTGLAHMHHFGVPATEIETINLSGGSPALRLYGAAHEQAIRLRIVLFELSLSHTPDLAIAIVIGLAQDK